MMLLLKVHSVLIMSLLLFFSMSDDFSWRERGAAILILLPILLYVIIK